MARKVYFISARCTKYSYQESLCGKFDNLLKSFDFSQYYKKNQIIPIKMHFGNPGANQTIRPGFIRQIVEAVKRIKARPFVTDSSRLNAYAYIELANQNGYNFLSLGAPLIIADGIYGNDSIEVDAGELLKKVSIASSIYDAKGMIVATHVKGHIQAGLGGSLKNIAMGGVTFTPRNSTWEKGRGRAHFLMDPNIYWDMSACNFCGICKQNCPTDAIHIKDKKWSFDNNKCWRCGRCIRICPQKALSTKQNDELFQRALAEQAKAVLQTFPPKKVVYINFLLDMQPECDCMPSCDTPVVPNLGIMMSDDPVAIDTASLDCIQKSRTLPNSQADEVIVPDGSDIFSALHNKDARGHIRYAEEYGLGTTHYELVEF
ncbi:MAG: DUF362 domain-containing protein [bacterium]